MEEFPKASLYAPVLMDLSASTPTRVFDAKEFKPLPIAIPLTVMSELNVFAPPKVWVSVLTKPLADADAFGMFKVITGVVDVFTTEEEAVGTL